MKSRKGKNQIKDAKENDNEETAKLPTTKSNAKLSVHEPQCILQKARPPSLGPKPFA